MTTTQWAFSAALLATLGLGGCTGRTAIETPGRGTPCATSADCGGAEFCWGETCSPKVLAGHCADSSEHKAAEVCQTGICLGGSCCATACPASDPLCRATSCDTTSGACQFPFATVACGPAESCVGGSHTSASSCDGHGRCALAGPRACDSLGCSKDGKTCLSSCHDSATCPAGEYCDWGQCGPQLGAGATCGPTSTSPAGAACVSGACLGTFCCASACDTRDPQCGASSCDSSGACIYPDQKTTCGTLQACVGDQYTPLPSCDGEGSCATRTPVTCAPYVCNESAAICYASCTAGGKECGAESYCVAPACALKKGPGEPCAATATSTSGQACLSGVCSSGRCCQDACAADPTAYNCQSPCDAQGACTQIAATCPNNFGCGGTTDCKTQCATNSDCYARAFCDPAGATSCCGKYHQGDTLYVDGSHGSDSTPCCGDPATPCQTLTHAMALVASSGTSGAILKVSNSNGSTSWTAKETYPIHLGWGVTLDAPSISFANRTKESDVFDVYAYDATDIATVTIQGGSSGLTADAVRIGFDQNLYVAPSYDYSLAYCHATVAVNDDVPGEAALPMVLSEVWMNSNIPSDKGYALRIGAGATVTLGPNPVAIGSGDLTDANVGAVGDYGIFCKGTGAFLKDDPAATSPVLSVEQQVFGDLDVEDGCTVSLTQGPQLGSTTTSPSSWDHTLAGCQAMNTYCFILCTYYPPTAAQIVGSGKLTFGSAAMPGGVHCAQIGFDAETSNASGSPTLALNGATIDLADQIHCDGTDSGYQGGFWWGYATSCAGILATEGSVSASASIFTHSYLGVLVDSNAVSADLSGGGHGGNAFTCNGASWGGSKFCGINSASVPPRDGADVVNATAAVGINAQNGTWDSWDAVDSSTQVWSCSDTTYSSCTCTGPGCGSWTSPGEPPDGADSIYLSANSAAIPLDTSRGAQSIGTHCP